MSNYISALKEISADHQLASKILLMPGFSSGNQFIHKLVDANIKLLNINIQTVFSLVKSLMEADLFRNDLEVIDNFHSTFLVYRVLTELHSKNELEYFNQLALTDGVLRMLADSIQEYRMAGYTSDDLNANDFISNKKKNDLFKILNNYEARLESSNYLDKAGLYKRAVEKDFKLSEEVLIKPDIFELTPVEESCLNSICPDSLKKYEIDIFQDDNAQQDMNFEFLNAYGSSNELINIIRGLKEQNIKLDNTAVYYLKKEPYSQLLYDFSIEHNLPVTFARGISIKNSQPAEIYFQELKRIDNDYSISGIVEPDALAGMILEKVKSDGLTDTEINREAREVVITKLELFIRYFDIPEEKEVVIERLEDLIVGERIGSASPEPGHLHLAPYQDSIWSNRHNKFFIGLEDKNMPGARNEDPVLLDRERSSYSSLKTRSDKNSEEIQKLKQIILSSKGNTRLSYSTFNIIENREQSPSSIYLEAFREDKHDDSLDYSDIKKLMPAPAGFVPPNKEQSFTVKDYWLYKYIKENEIENNQELLEHFYPDFKAGMKVLTLQVEPEFNQYTGNIDNPDDRFDPRKNDDLKVSASRLETMAKCPYQYFLKYILNISTPEQEKDQTTWLEAFEKGSLLHRIYRIFFEKLTEMDEEPSVAKHLDLILEIADQEAEKLKADISPPNDNIYRLELKNIRKLCRHFLNLAENIETDSKPISFEYGFDDIELSLSDDNKINIRGFIDRIDLNADGSYNIIDYKTGSDYSFSTNNYFNQGQQLQHALYAAAYERIDEDNIDVKNSIYFFVAPKANTPQYIRTNNRQDTLIEIIDILLSSISEGTFVPAPYDTDRTVCRICDFNKNICERDENDALTNLFNDDNHDKLVSLRRLKSYD